MAIPLVGEGSAQDVAVLLGAEGGQHGQDQTAVTKKKEATVGN